MELDGASAIVTGGASGLGRATARALVDGGASVVLVDLPGPRGEEAAAELGDRARFVAADVANEAEVQAAVDAASALAPLRVAVNCAGIVTANRTVGRDGPAPLDAFERTIRVNLIGTFNVTRLAAAAMAATEPVSGGSARRPGDARARRDREHGVGRRLRRADRPGRLLGVEGGRGRDDAADRARPVEAAHPGRHDRPRDLRDAHDGGHARRRARLARGPGAASVAARASRPSTRRSCARSSRTRC